MRLATEFHELFDDHETRVPNHYLNLADKNLRELPNEFQHFFKCELLRQLICVLSRNVQLPHEKFRNFFLRKNQCVSHSGKMGIFISN